MNTIRSEYWGSIPYSEAMERMNRAWRMVHDHGVPGSIYYMEHEEAITYGRSTPAEHLHRVPHELPTIEVPRGGLATYHGPGQLVGYCVIDLKRRTGGLKPDIHEFIRAIENGICGFLNCQYRLCCYVRPGLTGVWTGPAGKPGKIASIGICVRRWITSHGFAINIEPDLGRFGCIVPCGNVEDEMTSAKRECQSTERHYERIPGEMAAPKLHGHMTAALAEKGWCE